MALLVAADQPKLPLRSVTMFGSPFDVRAVPLVAPLRPLVKVAGGAPLGFVYRALGGAPAPIVKRAYQLAGAEKYVTKPLAILQNLDDRDFLAQIEAVDYFMDHMLAYPGRTFGQLYHRVLRTNDLARGSLKLGDRRIELSAVRLAVLSLAGTGDGIAPVKSVHHVAELLPNAEVELATAPGGHLGVLTGRAARRTSWATLDAFLKAHAAAPPKRRARRRTAAPAPA
jgi:polyhydroxyalkanoate synthase